MKSKYCKWYCTEKVDDNKYLFESKCGEKRIVSKHEKFFKHIYKNDDTNLCPNCKKIITVGALMD
ncbi:hypothetical protein [Clostridium botulinum]|uniref:hypothetical protein n=1 Tax=Clostridium botulinum TaxID=1491 RepID=UPI00249F3462|nr:hypothetical protein [Clostridium botulinum]MDU4596470.1 hypothetical protein [Clostridium sporogenes]WGZ48104.1 hypothetical protein HEQ52_18330 [Clostridium botulinum]